MVEVNLLAKSKTLPKDYSFASILISGCHFILCLYFSSFKRSEILAGLRESIFWTIFLLNANL